MDKLGLVFKSEIFADISEAAFKKIVLIPSKRQRLSGVLQLL